MKRLQSLLWIAAFFMVPGLLWAEGNPYRGYTNTVSYFLKYSGSTSFGPAVPAM